MKTDPVPSPRKPSRRHQLISNRREKRERPTATGSDWTPPRCPYPECSNHTDPDGRWFLKKGVNRPLCRSRPVQRYRCKGCLRYFSYQTFRMDYRDKKPWLNAQVFSDLSSGLGYRETARRRGMSLRGLQMKSRKIALHCSRAHLNLSLGGGRSNRFMFDEAITFEHERRTRPLTLPVLIASNTFYVVHAQAAPIRPLGRQSAGTERRVAALEKRDGERKDRHTVAVKGVLRRLRDHLAARPESPNAIELRTDMRPSYPSAIRRVFQRKRGPRVAHEVFKGDGHVRDPENPLFPINHTLAMMRDRLGRMRRRSWLATKKRRYLSLFASVFICLTNYVRPWKNGELESPAQLEGILSRRLSYEQMLGWRQDWGRELSPHIAAC
jgi:transposase-like protein